MIQILELSLASPSLKDNIGDADRLIEKLKKELKTEHITLDLDMLKILPELLRSYNYRVKCLLFRDRNGYILISVAGDDKKIFAGLAIDLGTTTIVLSLIDLETKKIIGETSFTNPQVQIGADILTRIHYAHTKEGLAELNRLIIKGLNDNIEKLCLSYSITPKDIYSSAIAGNTAMTHLFLSLPVNHLIREPYIPVINTPQIYKAKELNIRLNHSSRVFVFPNIGSYLGGDIISGILYCRMHRKEDISIFTDVGTNAEVVLGNKDWLIGCAGAAGPALEGGAAKIGMQAGPGVIDKIVITDALEFDIRTIGGLPPLGICGSGLIDLTAQLFSNNMIDKKGRFVHDKCGDRLIIKENVEYLIIVKKAESGTNKDITISSIDIDNLIRSKAAMFTILETLTSTVGIDIHTISDFFVAGTFGYFINPVSAISIGMLPDIPIEKYRSLGNSSLKGAVLFLTDHDSIKTVDNIHNMLTYLELNVNQEFMNRFSGAKFLPHTDAYLNANK